jgi:hypothetical protein
MGFPNIDAEEIRTIAIALVKRFQGPKLGPEGPSGEAAEDEHYGLLAQVIGQVNTALAVDARQREVRSRLSNARSFEN